MLDRVVSPLARHARFYVSVLCGGLAYAAARAAGLPAPALAAGDVFYATFLLLCLVMIGNQAGPDLKLRARNEDEGIVIVVLITVVTMGFFCAAVFEALANRRALDAPALIMAGAGALLGWFVLHTVMAFHYANLHYFDDPESPADDGGDLGFPGKCSPRIWDFLYFSFVVGMTCQVSDVAVKTTAMRKAVLGHGVISFLFNAVFIAMAVNAGVSLAG
jgi:uncharacterized membrane protein